MSDLSVKAESPLNEVDLSIYKSTRLTMQEVPLLGFMVLRGSPDDGRFKAVVTAVLGEYLPIEPNTRRQAKQVDILWLGPTEWLLITAPDQVAKIYQDLKTELGETFSSVSDVSGGYTAIDIDGEASRELLAKGCPLDIHTSQFALGQCAQTIVAKTGATIYPLDNAHKIRLIVRRSFADYFAVWLLDAAKEYSD